MKKLFCLFIYGLAGALITAGCGARLRPAPGVATLPGQSKTAAARVAGVQVTARGDNWRGQPSNLEGFITPMQVSIENNSNSPLRIRYNEFNLAAGGLRSAALPPQNIKGTATVATPVAAPLRPRFYSNRFALAPWYSPWYRGYRVWNRPWAFDAGYYNQYYSYWQIPLPTTDMLEQAIPEGVLEPEGQVSGYLYFQKLRDEVKQAEFTAQLVDAETGRNLGTINLPFVVK
jgi:hypothetical protein